MNSSMNFKTILLPAAYRWKTYDYFIIKLRWFLFGQLNSLNSTKDRVHVSVYDNTLIFMMWFFYLLLT